MSALEIGSIVGRVILDTSNFDANAKRVQAEMRRMATGAGTAAGDTRVLDRSLIGAAGAADKMAASAQRATTATRATSAATEKDAVMARQGAIAKERLGVLMAANAERSAAERQAILRNAAAQENANRIAASGTADFRRLAAAQASLIGSRRSLARVQGDGAASSSAFVTGLRNTTKMAGELGLVLGGIEIAKKAFEFVSAGKELTDALNGVQAVSRATDAQMKVVRTQVVGLGKDLRIPGATAVDAADAVLELVKAGIALPRALQAARPALLLASATQTDMADTARALGDSMDIWSIKGAGAAHAAKILGAATLGASHDLMGLFDALKQAGPSARALNIGLEDTATALVFLAKHGLSSQLGGTGLKVMFSTLSKDTPAGIRALQDLGVTAFDAQGKFEGFPKVFDQLHGAQQRFGADSHRFLHDLNAAFGSRAQNVAALFATATGEEFDKLKKHLEAGDLQKFADQMNRGVGAGFRQLTKEFTSFGVDVYSKFEPAVTSAVMWLGTNLPNAVNVASGLLGPLGSFVGGALSDGWHLLSGAISGVSTVLSPVLGLIDSLKTPLGAVATLTLGMWAAFKAGQGIASLVTSAVSGVETLALKAMYARDAVVGWGTSFRTAAATAAAGSTAIAGSAAGASEAVVASGTAARVGWLGMLGPLAAVGVGIGLLVSMFHKSDTASKEAADAAKAYTDALKSDSGSGGESITDAIRKQLVDNKVPETIASLNKALGSTQFSGSQFVTAISKAGKPLDSLRTRLQAVIDAGTSRKQVVKGALQQTVEEVTSMTPAAKAASQALTHLNAQYSGLTTAAKKDLIDTASFAGASSSLDKTAQKMGIATGTAQQYAQMLGIVYDKNGVTTISQKALDAATSGVARALAAASATGSEFAGAVETFSKSTGTAADRASLIGSILKAGSGDRLSFITEMNGAATAEKGLSDAINQASGSEAAATAARKAKTSVTAAVTAANRKYLASVVDLSTGTIHYTRAGAAPLINSMNTIQQSGIAAAQAMFQYARTTMNGKDAADAAYRVYKSQTGPQLEDQLMKLGLNSTEAGKLAKKYLDVPSKVRTLIEAAGTDPVVTVLNKIGKQLSYLTGKPWGAKVNVDDDAALAKLTDFQRRMGLLHDKTVTIRAVMSAPGGGGLGNSGSKTKNTAIASGSRAAFRRSDGTIPPNTTFTVGEGASHTWEGGMTDSQGRATIFSNAQSKAMGFRTPTAYASGSVGQRSIYAVDGGYGFQGQYFGGKDALKDARGALADFVHGLHAAARYAPETARLALAQMKAAYASGRTDSILRRAGQYYFGGQGYDSRALAQEARAEAHSAGRTTARGDFSSLRGVVASTSSTVSDVAGGLRTAEGDLRAVGASSRFLAGLKGLNRKIIAEVTARNKALAKLDKDAQTLADARSTLINDRSSFSGAISGSFDVSSAGADPVTGNITGGGILAQQKQAVVRARAFVAGITKLAKQLPGSYLRSIAAKGPDALPEVQALLGLSPAQMKELRAEENELNGKYGLANRGASIAAETLDRGAITRAQKSVANDKAAAAKFEKALSEGFNLLIKEVGGEVAGLRKDVKNLKIQVGGPAAGHFALIVRSGERYLKKANT